MIRFVASLLVVLLAGAAQARPLTVASRDPAIEARIADLLARMTLEEKVGQMFMDSWTETLDLDQIRAGGTGAVINCPTAEEVAKAQKAAQIGRAHV